MGVRKNGFCEFCGKKRKWLAATTFNGYYCESCLKLERAEALDALRRIKNSKWAEKAKG